MGIYVHYDLRPEDLLTLEKHTTLMRSGDSSVTDHSAEKNSTEVHRLFAANLEKLTSGFNEIDNDHDEHVWLEEAKRLLYKTIPSISPAEIEKVFVEMGANEHGHITREQWLDYFQRFKPQHVA